VGYHHRWRAPAIGIALLASWQFSTAPAGEPPTLKLATWNLEWLLTPSTFAALKGHCSADDDSRRVSPRQLPCDVAGNLERSAVDLATLARYARALDADVIALQEVDGANAARQVFADYEFCFTRSPALQNAGFAIRRGIPFRCGEDVLALSQGDAMRRGVTVVLYPGSASELYLLGVHLKSGCSSQRLDSHNKACERLARQGPVIENWVATEARAGHRFALLGDFNRNLLGEHGDGLWQQINRGNSPAERLVSVASRADFRNCAPGMNHSGFIDYILLGATLAPRLVTDSIQRVTYSTADAAHFKLSDHCPLAARLTLVSAPHDAAR
jgi:endonuclease/exonuclease/phosphatase family metal-dependent hydrolase